MGYWELYQGAFVAIPFGPRELSNANHLWAVQIWERRNPFRTQGAFKLSFKAIEQRNQSQSLSDPGSFQTTCDINFLAKQYDKEDHSKFLKIEKASVSNLTFVNGIVTLEHMIFP